MAKDAISLLQNVKQAEEEKARALAEARRDAEERVRKAHKTPDELTAEVRARVAQAEPQLREEIGARGRKDMEALERWHQQKQEAMRGNSKAALESTVKATCDAFKAEWQS